MHLKQAVGDYQLLVFCFREKLACRFDRECEKQLFAKDKFNEK